MGNEIRFLTISVIVTLLWGTGQWFRDSTWLTGMCFHIPSPVLAAGLIACSLWNAVRQKWRSAGWIAGLAIIPVVFVLQVENHWAFPEPRRTTAPLRIVHWNVAGHLGPGMHDVLLAARADCYVLSEIPDVAAVDAFRHALGEKYQSEVFENLAVVATGSVLSDGWVINRERARMRNVLWQPSEKSIRVYVVDLPSAVFCHRDPWLREVTFEIAAHRPDIIVGDFNPMRRSSALQKLPMGYRHAYESVGAGWGYSWPVPVPMFALDHCLHSASVTPSHYKLRASRYSDHRMQIFEFE